MAAPEPLQLHGLYTEEDIKIIFRYNHALQNLNSPPAHPENEHLAQEYELLAQEYELRAQEYPHLAPEYEHLAFIIVFKHQTRKQFCCSGNLHLLPLITSAANYLKSYRRPHFLPWVPAFLERSEFSTASGSRDRIFEYLGYHSIVSIEYYTGSSTKWLGAQELSEKLCEIYNESFPPWHRVSRFPMPRAPREWLSRLGIEHAILTIESLEASKLDEGAIPRPQGTCDRCRAEAVTKMKEVYDWIVIPESLASELVELRNGDADVVPKQTGGEVVIKDEQSNH